MSNKLSEEERLKVYQELGRKVGKRFGGKNKNPIIPGSKFNMWTVIKEVEGIPEGKKIRPAVLVKCDCGNEAIKKYRYVKEGYTKSCGCLKIKLFRERSYKHGDAHRNKKKYYLYNIWGGIKKRCFNENSWAYEYYGGRGITMFPEWIDNYIKFKEWIIKNIGERPTKTHSLDRIDNDGNYEPGNLRCATKKQQTDNRRPLTNKREKEMKV